MQIMFNNLYYENFVVYEIMWKNIVNLDRSKMTMYILFYNGSMVDNN
jgi:hypothetical protein